MLPLDYKYILQQSWHITRRHRVLWLFGLLASLNGGVRLTFSRDLLPPVVQRWVASLTSGPDLLTTLGVLFLLGVLLGLALLVLHALGQAALIEQVNRTEDGGLPGVRGGWNAARRRVWTLSCIHLLTSLPVSAVMLLGSVPPLLLAVGEGLHPAAGPGLPGLLGTLALSLSCLLPALLAGMTLAVPASVIRRLAGRACLLEHRSAWTGLVRAWEMSRLHLRAVALLWLILAPLAVAIIGMVGLLLLPLAVATYAVIAFAPPSSASLVVALCCAGALWLLMTAARSIAESFFSAAWTLAYREMAGLGRTGEEAPLWRQRV